MNWTEKARFLRAMIEQAAVSLSDEEAFDAAELFPKWQAGLTYIQGDRARYDGILYKCAQTHTSQDDWHPDVVPALWVRVAEPGEIPTWVQPAGAHDAYAIGDKVRWNGNVWVSSVDANIWEPGVFGWDLV